MLTVSLYARRVRSHCPARKFQWQPGATARVIEIQAAGQLIAGGGGLADNRRFHLWTGAVDYGTAVGFSPYSAPFSEAAQEAVHCGKAGQEGMSR
jgi:hypothetical protein